MRRVPPALTANARALRTTQTEPERLLWHRLSHSRPRFTRQLVVCPYILDLACRTARLAVELDGSQHLDTAAYDARRTAFLEAQGWTILRFWNDEVLANSDGVTELILARAATHLGGTPPTHVAPRQRKRPPKDSPPF